MKRFNKVSAIVLAVVSLLTCVAMYLNMFVMPIAIVSAIVSISITFVAMMQTVYDREWYDYNPSTFWFVYSTISAAILVIGFYLHGFGIIQLTSATFGLGFMLTPVLGVFIGDIYRRIILDEMSAVCWQLSI